MELEHRGHEVMTWPDWAWKRGGCLCYHNQGTSHLPATIDIRGWSDFE